MSGILAWGSYLPHARLDRASIAAVAGAGGGKGTRSVASYDEDTTTMGVAAARRALIGVDHVSAIAFTTPNPAYLEKTNATAIHAALRLPHTVAAFDANGAVRSAMGALRSALMAPQPVLVVAADVRGGLPGGSDETSGGDGAGALVVGAQGAQGVQGAPVAELVSWCSVTEEFLDRWRIPGAPAARQWEERFGELRYLDCGMRAWSQMLDTTGLTPDDLDEVIVCGTHDRAVSAVKKKLGIDPTAERLVDNLSGRVGNLGAAAPFVLLAQALENANSGQTIALLVLADGAELVVFRTTDALSHRAGPTVSQQAGGGAPISYGTYLRWRGMLPVEPPRRPEPSRPSASAAARNVDWKFGLAGADGVTVADQQGTIVTFTVDRLAYSMSPPVVFAIVDFDSGARMPVELTDCDPNAVAIGDRVEMTFRRLFTADGIHNYFWKARPVFRAGS